MKTSTQGRALIEQREGRRLTAYRDSKGIWTIGVGHAATGLPPRPYAGMTITEAQCDALLAADLAPVEVVIDACVTLPLSQNEFDALASLGFNIGAAGLRKSTVLKRLNLGDIAGAADAFMLWDRPAELTERRAAERKQFLTPGEPIAEVRAATLTAKAAVAQGKAKATKNGGVVIAAAGAATSAAMAGGGHAHLAWIIGAMFGLGAVIDGVMSVLHRQAAQTLAANALTQAAATAPPGAPSVSSAEASPVKA